MTRFSQFLLGIRFWGRGISFLMRHPSLWPWAGIPALLSVGCLALSWGFFVHYSPDLYSFLFSHLGLQELPAAQGFWATLGYAGLWVLKQFLKILIFLLGLIFLSLAAFLVYLIVAAPFLDILAEKTTTLSQNREPPPFTLKRFLKSVGQTVVVESKKVLLFLAAPLFLLILNLIPFLGGFLYALSVCLFGMWALGWTCVDYPMGHQLFPFRERLAFARRFKYALTGFGFPFLIPFAPLLLQTPMVIGGTLLYHELLPACSSTKD